MAIVLVSFVGSDVKFEHAKFMERTKRGQRANHGAPNKQKPAPIFVLVN
jgi:hypothetical protein